MERNTADLTHIELNDLHLINILLCYLLYRIKQPITPDALYDIAVSTGIINYFYYQDSLDFLTKNGSLELKPDKKGEPCYTLTPQGELCAMRLKNYVPKIFRDKLVLAALRYTARQKYENEVRITYESMDKGYYVHLRCLDTGDDLLDMKMFAPDMRQAKLLGERIMKNPLGFYGKILDIALQNEEEPYDLSDN